MKILVFQQNNRGVSKIAGIRQYGKSRFDLTLFSIDTPLPPVVEDASLYFPDMLDADLVLDYLKHPDLSHDLALLCGQRSIPVIASGKKTTLPGVYAPPICCALARHKELGVYGEQFGAPEFEVRVRDERIVTLRVIRGAPCGATWNAAARMTGLRVDEALTRMGLDTQIFCTADPSNWDPISGKSPVHLAGDLHRAALAAALKKAEAGRCDASRQG